MLTMELLLTSLILQRCDGGKRSPSSSLFNLLLNKKVENPGSVFTFINSSGVKSSGKSSQFFCKNAPLLVCCCDASSGCVAQATPAISHFIIMSDDQSPHFILHNTPIVESQA